MCHDPYIYVHSYITSTNISLYDTFVVGMIPVAAVAIFRKVWILKAFKYIWKGDDDHSAFMHEVIFECNYFKY